jgi:DUF2934 family protein
MKDDRAEAGTKKKAPRRTAARAAKKAPAAAPRRAKAAATSSSSSNTNSKKRSAPLVEIETAAVAIPLARVRRAPITEEQRQAMVAERAYFKAERRGFRGGDSAQDWYEAESEIDAMILRGDDES